VEVYNHLSFACRQIEEMRVLPEKISSQLAKKEFLKATAGLTKSLGKEVV
jgi:hypothetical protein